MQIVCAAIVGLSAVVAATFWPARTERHKLFVGHGTSALFSVACSSPPFAANCSELRGRTPGRHASAPTNAVFQQYRLYRLPLRAREHDRARALDGDGIPGRRQHPALPIDVERHDRVGVEIGGIKYPRCRIEREEADGLGPTRPFG